MNNTRVISVTKKNIKRNKLFSLASIATIAACVFLLGLFYSIIIKPES